MKKHTSLALAIIMVAGIVLTGLGTSGCGRQVHRSRIIFGGDPNVTVTKLQRKKVKGRMKPFSGPGRVFKSR